MARPVKEKLHLYEKRDELVWALDFQGYNGTEIAVVFNIDDSVISRIMKKIPKDWKPKWIKAEK